eukprot:sb/3469331/
MARFNYLPELSSKLHTILPPPSTITSTIASNVIPSAMKLVPSSDYISNISANMMALSRAPNMPSFLAPCPKPPESCDPVPEDEVTLRVNVRVARHQGKMKIKVNVGVEGREEVCQQIPEIPEEETDSGLMSTATEEGGGGEEEVGDNRSVASSLFPPPYHTDIRVLGDYLERYDETKQRLVTFFRNQIDKQTQCNSCISDMELFHSIRCYFLKHVLAASTSFPLLPPTSGPTG